EVTVEKLVQSPYTQRQLVKQISKTVAKGRFIRAGNLTLDTRTRAVLCAGTGHTLTPKLFALLKLLIKHQGQIVYRKTIMQEVWETDYMGDTRTLDVHIRWLREKIEDDPGNPKYVLTVRGAGYRFIANPDE
ncbi:MAG: winged helix-turn-helix domain-containing protein, partial [Anaerolineae bacterium]